MTLELSTGIPESSPNTVLGAATLGEYEAIVTWNQNGFNCNSISQFEVLVYRSVFSQCNLAYSTRLNNDKDDPILLLRACESGAEKVIQEKKNSCHDIVCRQSGNVIGSVVASISCHSLHSQWSAFVPVNCIETTISTCITCALSSIEKKKSVGECNDLKLVEQHGFSAGIQHLCNSLVRASVT